MRALETRGLFDRALEALPSDMELQERGRAGRGLTRPELAVLLSYAKIALQHDILESGCRTSRSWKAGSPAISRRCCASAIAPASTATACAARSSRSGSPTPSSTAAGRPWRCGSPARRGGPTSDVAHAFMAAREVFDLPRAVAAHRCARRQGAGRGAAAALSGDARSGERADAVVPARRRGDRRPRGHHRAPQGGPRRAGGRARERAAAAPQGRAGAGETSRLGEGGIPADLAADVARLEVLGQAPAITEIARGDRPGGGRDGAHLPRDRRAAAHRRPGRAEARPSPRRTSTTASPSPRRSASSPRRRPPSPARRSGPAAARPGSPSRATGSPASRRRSTRSAGEGTLTVSRLLVAAGQLSELRRGRSFSISQEGPNSGSGQIRSQRKPARS